MMLKSGDSNLNRFAQVFGESAMESLKQAILEQELTFRNQVRELHRLYRNQKNLMQELRQNRVNALLRNHQINFISIDLNDNNNVSETDVSKFNRKFDVEKSLLSSVGSGFNEIIDLEDSMDLGSHEKAKLSFNVCCEPSTVHFGGAHDRRLKEQMAHVSCVGIDDSSLDSVNDHSRNTHGSRTVLFDLNKPVSDSKVHNSSQDSMLADYDTKNLNDMESKQGIHVLSSAYPVEGSTGSSDGALSINEAPISSIELSEHEKRVFSQADKLRLVALQQDSNITFRNSINLLQTEASDSTEKLSNHEESEEDTLSSHATAADDAQQNALLKKFSLGLNSNDMSERDSLSITDDSVISQSHSTENEMSCYGKFKSEQHDIATAAAAQTLMAISFGMSANYTTKKVIEYPCDDKSDQLQVSSDSFETMTMHLSEITSNDVIMPDVPRLNVREKDETRIRSKRGKGLRNFQKEILPGLVSLSRHEICEDLHSINYRDRRNSGSTRRNLFVPVTCRRSRLHSWRRPRRSFRW